MAHKKTITVEEKWRRGRRTAATRPPPPRAVCPWSTGAAATLPPPRRALHPWRLVAAATISPPCRAVHPWRPGAAATLSPPCRAVCILATDPLLGGPCALDATALSALTSSWLSMYNTILVGLKTCIQLGIRRVKALCHIRKIDTILLCVCNCTLRWSLYLPLQNYSVHSWHAREFL